MTDDTSPCEQESCESCPTPMICNSLVLCSGLGCPIAEACVRAVPNWSDGRFFAGVPYRDNNCDYFIQRR